MHLAAAEAFECFFSSYEKQGSEISVKNEDFPTARKKRPQKDEEQNGGRRAFREAIEENARAEESAFYTGQFIGFLYRRSQGPAGQNDLCRVGHQFQNGGVVAKALPLRGT